MDVIVIALVIWFGCGLLAATVASSKGHSGGSWFVLGLLLGILALLAAVGLSDRRDEAKAEAEERINHEHDWEEVDATDPLTGRTTGRSIYRCRDCKTQQREQPA